MNKYLLIALTLFLFFQCTHEDESSTLIALKKYEIGRNPKNKPKYTSSIDFEIIKNGKGLTIFGWHLEIDQIMLQGDIVWVVSGLRSQFVTSSICLDVYQDADIIYRKNQNDFSIELILRSSINKSINNDGTFFTSGAFYNWSYAYVRVDEWLRDKVRRPDTMKVHVPSQSEYRRYSNSLIVEKHILIEPKDGEMQFSEYSIYENKTPEYFTQYVDGPGNYVIMEQHSFPRFRDLKEKPYLETIPFRPVARPDLMEIRASLNEIRKNTNDYIEDISDVYDQAILSDFSGNRIQSAKALTQRNVKAAIQGFYTGGRKGMFMCSSGINLVEEEEFNRPSDLSIPLPISISQTNMTGETTITLLDLCLQDLNGAEMEDWPSVFNTDTFNYEQFYKNIENWCQNNNVAFESEAPHYSIETLQSDIRKTLEDTETSLMGASFSYLDKGMIIEDENDVFNSYFYAFQSAPDSKSFSRYSRNAEILVLISPLNEASKDFLISIMEITRDSFSYWDRILE